MPAWTLFSCLDDKYLGNRFIICIQQRISALDGEAWGITFPFWWAGCIQTVKKSQGDMAGNRLFWRGWNIRVSLTATVCSIASRFVKAFLFLGWKVQVQAILVWWKTGWNWRAAIMDWVKFSEAGGQSKCLQVFKVIMEPGSWNKRITTNAELQGVIYIKNLTLWHKSSSLETHKENARWVLTAGVAYIWHKNQWNKQQKMMLTRENHPNVGVGMCF